MFLVHMKTGCRVGTQIYLHVNPMWLENFLDKPSNLTISLQRNHHFPSHSLHSSFLLQLIVYTPSSRLLTLVSLVKIPMAFLALPLICWFKRSLLNGIEKPHPARSELADHWPILRKLFNWRMKIVISCVKLKHTYHRWHFSTCPV